MSLLPSSPQLTAGLQPVFSLSLSVYCSDCSCTHASCSRSQSDAWSHLHHFFLNLSLLCYVPACHPLGSSFHDSAFQSEHREVILPFSADQRSKAPWLCWWLWYGTCAGWERPRPVFDRFISVLGHVCIKQQKKTAEGVGWQHACSGFAQPLLLISVKCCCAVLSATQR